MKVYNRESIIQFVEYYISDLHFPTEPRGLYEPIEFMFDTGGKRLRPAMLLMSCNLFSDSVVEALPAAAAVEIFHNFTLVHDDFMDNADVRRGRPAVHKKWSPATAILSGDAMLIYAYTLLEELPSKFLPVIFKEFNQMAMQVCEGQQFDMDFEKRDDVTLEQYIRMIKLKTSALMGHAGKMGAIIGGASNEDAELASEFCTNLGIAFQIQDDLLDTYGDDSRLGKKTGGDIVEGKKTYLMVKALEQLDKIGEKELLVILHEKEIDDAAKIKRVKQIYDSVDIQRITEDAIEHYLNVAEECLHSISVSGERLTTFEELPKRLHKRTR